MALTMHRHIVRERETQGREVAKGREKGGVYRE